MKNKVNIVVYIFTLFSILCSINILGCKTNNDIIEESPKPITEIIVDETTDEPALTTTTTSTTTTTTTTIPIVIDERLKWTATDRTSPFTLERNIRNLFITIEEKIAKKDFEGWYGAISESYRIFLSDKINLQKMSQKSPYLHNKGIILQTPKDYFDYVVIPAREGNKLEYRGYKKINNSNIRVINGIPGYDSDYSYDFIYENGSWHLNR